MSNERTVACEYCGGAGEYDAPHPMWGSPSCPEAYVQRKCGDCEGTGRVLACDCDVIEDCDECRERWMADQVEAARQALAKEDERWQGFDPEAYQRAMTGLKNKPPLSDDELPF